MSDTNRARNYRRIGGVYGVLCVVNAVAAVTYSNLPWFNWLIAAMMGGAAFAYIRLAKQIVRWRNGE